MSTCRANGAGPKKQISIRGLNKDHNHDLKGLFKGAATRASVIPGPFREFYLRSLCPRGYRDYTEAQCPMGTSRLQDVRILTLEPERLKNRSTTTGKDSPGMDGVVPETPEKALGHEPQIDLCIANRQPPGLSAPGTDPRRRYLIKTEPRWKKKISEFLEMIPPLRGGDFQGIAGLSSDDSLLVGVSAARERSFTKAPALSNIGSMSPARLSPSAVASPHCRLLCHLAGKILAKKQRRLSGQPRIKRLSSLAGGWKSSNSCSPPVWGEIFS